MAEREEPVAPWLFDQPDVRARIARALEATGGDPTPWRDEPSNEEGK